MGPYKTYLDVPEGISIINPFGINEIVVEQEINTEDLIFWNKKSYQGTLKFTGEDFHKLYNWDRGADRCLSSFIYIYQICEGDEELVFVYQIMPDKIEFYPDQCVCTLDVSSDVYDAFEERGDIEYNLFELTPFRTVWNVATNPPSNPIAFRVENGLILYDVLLGLLIKTYGTITLKSKFFGWNETQVPYGLNSTLTKLILASNSDILKRRQVVTNPPPAMATKLMGKLNDILLSICDMFNLKCAYDDEIGEFRIEHLSYFDTVSGVIKNATSGKSGIINDGALNKYKFADADLYSTETFESVQVTFMAQREDVVGLPIEYETCGYSLQKIRKRKAVFNLSITEDYDLNPRDSDLEGIFIGALDPSTDTLYREPPILAMISVPNNVISWAYLAKYYHDYGKPYPNAIINNVATTVDVIRTRYQEGIKIHSCCNDETIINGTCITGLGEGRIMKTSKQFGKSYIEADVYFYIT